MADWDDLRRELGQWADDGAQATFWWRDDDAGPDDGLLALFLEQRAALGVPLALAVVPDLLCEAVADALCRDPGSTVLQHGVAHVDRSGGGRRKTELCAPALDAGLAPAMAGARDRLARRFGSSFASVMVPPWNRIDPQVEAILGGLGFTGLSTLGVRPRAHAGGLARANVHIDIVDWKGGRRFAGEAACLEAALAHLRARRNGAADRAEATGLMTHHRWQDDACRRFVDGFVAFLRDNPASCWLDAGQVFAGGRTGGGA